MGGWTYAGIDALVEADRRRGDEPSERKRRKRKTLRLSEKDIERTIVEILEWDGWVCRKMEENFSERKQKRTGEKGMPDRLCIRYTNISDRVPVLCAEAEVMWLELKSKDGRVDVAQHNWHVKERRLGALVLLAGKDFPATIEGFREFYASSGLQRRK